MKLTLLTAVTAANSPPSGATAGTAIYRTGSGTIDSGGFTDNVNQATLIMNSTAGSGTMTLSFARLWGYSSVSAVWYPLGTGADATKGYINEGGTFGETGTDTIAHTEIVCGFGDFDRIYLEVGSFGGTLTAISAWLIARG